ncbi:DUF1919 domain-containing protein [Streptococcus suis]|nr:DUF1919 domain-containing protein [Streptococcus suis]HEM5503957.1 DUF1919 domain-containing protein [Streptococcus suis]
MNFIKKKYRQLLRLFLNKKNRNSIFKNEEPCSIISSNCVGGVILHELGMPFNTPTINLYMEPKSYLTFVSNLQYYLKVPLEEKEVNLGYPVGHLNDEVTIHFLHYENFSQAKYKWEERAKRVNFNRLYFILTDRDGLTQEDAVRFDNLPYENKVLLACSDFPGIKNIHNFGPNYREGESIVDLCQYKSWFSGRRYIDDFDYVDFINNYSLEKSGNHE